MLVAVVAAIVFPAVQVNAKTVAVSASSRGLGIFIGSGQKGHKVVTKRHSPVISRHKRVVQGHRRPAWRSHHYRRFHVIRPHRPVILPRPHRFHTIVPPRPKIVIVRRPVVRESTVINIWITNSNGSKTPVKLTRQGFGYVGPRGEYYHSMPTNEQLRVVYGF